MLKHYARVLYAGSFFSEDEARPVERRDPALVSLDGWAYGFWFEDREEVDAGGETLVGPWKNRSPRHLQGEVFDLDRVKREVPNSDILQRNMGYNNWSRVLRCKQGFIDLRDDDVVLHPPERGDG